MEEDKKPAGDMPEDKQVQDEATPTENPTEAPIKKEKPPKDPTMRKKWMVLILAMVVIVFGAYFVLGFSNDKESNDGQKQTNTAQSDNNQNSEQPEQSFELDKILYFHTDDVDEVGAIFSRPASGGERERLFDVPANANFSATSSRALATNSFAFKYNGNLFFQDRTQEPVQIFEPTGLGSEIQNAVASEDGSKVILGAFDFDEVGTATYTIDSDGSNPEVVAGGSDSFNPVQWSSDGSQASTFYLGGGRGGPFLPNDIFSLATQQRSTVFSGIDLWEFLSHRFNSDFSQAIYSYATQDDDYLDGITDEQILANFAYGGVYYGPPCEIRLVNVQDGEVRTILNYGELGETDEGGGIISCRSSVGWTNSPESKPFYTLDNALYIYNQESGNASKVFETSQGDISLVYWASDTEYLVSVGTEGGFEEPVIYFNLETQTAANVMETGPYTVLYGVTTK